MMNLRSQCCHNCSDRHVGCHADCEAYAAARAELEQAKQRLNNENEYVAYVAAATREMRKHKRKKK